MTKTQQLAIVLHEILCKENHTDGCPWWYEKTYEPDVASLETNHKWEDYAHKRYLKMAETMEKKLSEEGISTEALIKTFQVLKEIKNK
jgi:hypothetical protein